MQLTSMAETDGDQLHSNLSRYFEVSKFSTVLGEDMLFFDVDGLELQIINVYDVGLGFGRRIEISALRKSMEVLQGDSPKWSDLELVAMSEFSESIGTDNLDGCKVITDLGRNILKSIWSSPEHIELRNVHAIPIELRFLFENVLGHLSIIRICELMPKAQCVTFSNVPLEDMMNRGDEYTECITECITLSPSRSLCRIEFCSEFLPEFPEFEVKGDIKQIADSEWFLDFNLHENYYLRIVAEKKAREEQTALKVSYSKTFDLVLDAKEEIFNQYDEHKMHELAVTSINTVLGWSGIDDCSFNVDVVDIHVDGVHIEYLLISEVIAELNSVANIVRRANLHGLFVDFQSMRIPIRLHYERIDLSFAERAMAKEMDKKWNKELSVDLQSNAQIAALDWTSKRDDKVTEIRQEILKKEQKEKEEADRKDAERRAKENKLEHELGLNLMTGCKMVDQPLFRLNAEQLWQCIGWWIDNDVKHQNALSAMKRVCAEYHISGAALCYAFLEKKNGDKLIVNVLRKQMERHLTVETMDIIMKTMRNWMFTVNAGTLHSASTQLAARMMIQIPIQNLKNVLLEKHIDGKWFIKESKKKPNGLTDIVRASTGWSMSDCILLKDVLIRRISLPRDQILEKIQSVGGKGPIPMSLINEFVRKLTLDYDLEDIQYELQTQGTVCWQFIDSVHNLLVEILQKQNKEDLALDDGRSVAALFDVVSSALIQSDGVVRRSSDRSNLWICSFCGNLNVFHIVDCVPRTNISKCSLCGIQHKDAVIMALKQIATPFFGIERAPKTAKGQCVCCGLLSVDNSQSLQCPFCGVEESVALEMVEQGISTPFDDIMQFARNKTAELHCAQQKDSALYPAIKRIAFILMKQRRYQMLTEEAEHHQTLTVYELRRFVHSNEYEKVLLRRITSGIPAKVTTLAVAASVLEFLNDDEHKLCDFASLFSDDGQLYEFTNLDLWTKNGVKRKTIKFIFEAIHIDLRNIVIERYRVWLQSLNVAQIEADYKHIVDHHLKDASAPHQNAIFLFFDGVIRDFAKLDSEQSIEMANEDYKEMDDEKDDDEIMTMLNGIRRVLCNENRPRDIENDDESDDAADTDFVPLSIREEIYQIVHHDAFIDVLSESARIHKEWNEKLPGTRRANEYAAKYGILRNQSITVKHVAAIVLYVKHSELSDQCICRKFSELCSLCFVSWIKGFESGLVPMRISVVIIWSERYLKRFDFSGTF